MQRQYRLTKAMVLLYARNRVALFWNVVFPVFLLMMFSTIFGSRENDGIPYVTWLVPGLVVLNTMAFGLIRSSSNIIDMRQNGVLRRLQATPTSTWELCSSYIMVNVFIGLAQSAALVGVANLFYGVTLPIRGALQVLPILVIGSLTFIAMGQMISGLLSQISAAVALGQLVYYSQMFVSDLFIPLSDMPHWIQRLAPLLPAHALVHAIRPAFTEHIGETALGFHLGVVVIYALMATLLAARLFRWEPTA